MDSLAWAAGVLEGEGAFYATANPDLMVARIQCKMTDPEILRRVKRAIGVGRLNGPYPQGLRRKPAWVYQITSQDDVVRIAWKLYPFMGCRRKVQILRMLDKIGRLPLVRRRTSLSGQPPYPAKSLGDNTMATRKEASEAAGRRRLGRGLSGLISTAVSITVPQKHQAEPGGTDPVQSSQGEDGAKLPSDVAQSDIRMLLTDEIRANPRQPRQRFDEAALEALAASIRTAGLMQPIVVRPGLGGGYQIVVGERRWRAAQRIGLSHVPAVVRELDDQATIEWALIENIQREDLNPMERAEAFKGLAEEHGLTHQALADRVGLDRSSITNLLRLHELDDFCKDAVRNGHISAAQAKILLSISNIEARQHLAKLAVREGWSVRTLQGRARSLLEPRTAAVGAPRAAEPAAPHVHRKDLERRLSDHLGTRVRIDAGRKKGTGRLMIEFYSLDQFDGLMARLGFRSM